MDDYDKLVKEAEELTGEISQEQASKLSDDKTKELSVKDMLVKLLEKDSKVAVPEKIQKKKGWSIFGNRFNKTIAKSSALSDYAVIIYLNQKGYIEEPRVVPIEVGNMVIIKGAPYELDPRTLWIKKDGNKIHKVYIIKEIDRRPVSNLDIDEIRQRGDSTDSDTFLIKAMLKEQIGTKEKKPMPKWILWIIGVIVVGALIFFFTQGGGSNAVNVIP